MEENIINKFYETFPMGDVKYVPRTKEVVKWRVQVPEIYKDKKVLIVGDAFSHEGGVLRARGFTNLTSTVKAKREIKFGEPIICDLHSLPFPDEEFDFVYCSHVLEHCVAPMIALREIYRVLKKGGEALLWMPYSNRSQHELYHLSCFRPPVWVDLINKTHFVLTEQKDNPSREEWGYWVKKV